MFKNNNNIKNHHFDDFISLPKIYHLCTDTLLLKGEIYLILDNPILLKYYIDYNHQNQYVVGDFEYSIHDLNSIIKIELK